jgi:D-beta-D-heptose 7-phosphate kinase/D-beta-D-heptose 1-phosphate adenosyltransferase
MRVTRSVPAPEGVTLDLVERVRRRGGVIAFTNGVFDLLHVGHIRCLRAAKALGDVLVVGINSDRSVRAIKGPGRPINREQDRAEVLLALAPVDAVMVFDDETPRALIARLQPDVLVKGADWGSDEIVGRDVVEARGGRVVRVEMVPDVSSTDLLRKVMALRGR